MEKSILLEKAIASGKTQWLRDLLENHLYELDLPIVNYQDWFEKIIRVMEERGLVNPSQQKNYLTNIRGAIKLLNPDHPALDTIKFDKETWIDINNKETERIAQRVTKLITNPEAIVDKAISLLKSHLWSNIVAGLAVLIGRRISEILKTGEFKYKTEYSLIFSGALKRRNESVECVFEIPTLTKATTIIEAITKLRRELANEIQDLSLKELNTKYSKAVSKQCDAEFAHLVPPRDGKDNGGLKYSNGIRASRPHLYTHLFRAVYATIATHWYCPVTIPEIEYRAAICGHYQILDEKNPELRRSLAASRNYFDYKIADETGNIDGRLGIKLNMPGVKILEQFDYKDENIVMQANTSVVPLQGIKPIDQPDKTKYHMLQNQQIPSFLLPRLETIAKQLSVPEVETIQIMFNWIEMGLALTQSLEMEEFNPHLLFNKIEKLKSEVNYWKTLKSEDVKLESISDPPVRLTTQLKEDNIDNLCASVKILSETLSQQLQNSLSVSSQRSMISTPPAIMRQKQKEEIVDKGIDAIVKFNNDPSRTHNDKWFINVSALRSLTKKGDKLVARVLQARQAEIDEHHSFHNLTSRHNCRGRFSSSIQDVISLSNEEE